MKHNSAIIKINAGKQTCAVNIGGLMQIIDLSNMDRETHAALLSSLLKWKINNFKGFPKLD